MTSSLTHFPTDWFVDGADAALKNTLTRVLRDGAVVTSTGKTASLSAGKSSRELIGYQLALTNARDRIVWNEKSPLNAVSAIARFVWMMAGSDRLADIAFYEPKVSAYTDDGISVPGSSYGHRIVQVRPGINQLTSAIERLKEDPSSRRVAITIYQPEDIVRQSADIPCAFGLFYHVRNDQLHSTLIMRSNNAVTLLPFNIFEFSLLAEIVACEIGVELGPFIYHAASMHVFDDMAARAQDMIGATVPPHPAMPPMPRAPSPLLQVAELVKLEAELRHESAGVTKGNISEWIEKGNKKLDPYWRQLYFVLLAHVAKKNLDAAAVGEVVAVFESPWRERVSVASMLPKAGSTAAGSLALVKPMASIVVPIANTRAREAVKKAAASWEERNASTLTWQRFTQVEERLGPALAAREGEPISDAEFESALASSDDGEKGA
jgi:thymidylate synthase